MAGATQESYKGYNFRPEPVHLRSGKWRARCRIYRQSQDTAIETIDPTEREMKYFDTKKEAIAESVKICKRRIDAEW